MQPGDITDTDRLNWLETDNGADRLYTMPGGFMLTDGYGAGKTYPSLRQAIDAAMMPNNVLHNAPAKP